MAIACLVLNWAIWIVFALELVTMLAVVSNRWRWLRKHPLEVAVVLLTPPVMPASLQAARALRLLRVLRLVRLMKVPRKRSPATSRPRTPSASKRPARRFSRQMRLWEKIAEDDALATQLQLETRGLCELIGALRVDIAELQTTIAHVLDGTTSVQLERLRQKLATSLNLEL